jgi:hypothetical protein
MNFSDLFVVIVLATALYGLIVALTGRRHFLANAVNPHRGAWLLAAFTIFWTGVSLLRLEAQNWDFERWLHLLSQLVSDAPTPAKVKVAAVALLLSIVFLSLLGWCWAVMPRDPGAFHKLEHRRAALRYYVTRLKGGLCYGVLAWGSGERLEETADMKQLHRLCPHMPKIQPPAHPPRPRTPEEQVSFWRTLAQQIHERMGQLDTLIEPAHQGRNRRLVFDGEFGGFFFKYLRLPDPRSPQEPGLYLFGATLSQTEMDTRRADQHFQLLMRAMQNIDRSIRLG